MGISGRRRPAPVRKGLSRRIPGGLELADNSGQARSISRGVRRFRFRARRAVWSTRRRAFAEKRRNRPPPRQDRIDDQQRETGARTGGRVRVARGLFLESRAEWKGTS